MSDIHPGAVVESGAQLGERVKVGPFCVIGSDVVLGDDCVLRSHVVLGGRTDIGARSEIFPFASIGLPPQDLKYAGEASRLEIGAETAIREYVTINPGTEGGGMVTRVGSNCLFMAGSHVAHDCVVGNHVILVNNATIGGHVQVGDYAIIGGLSAVHQFVRIGAHAMVGGMSGIENDVIPFGSAMGDRARLSGLNIIGLKRRQFSREDIHIMRTAYRLLFANEGTLAERVADVVDLYKDNEPVMDIINFIREESPRPVLQPRAEPGG